MKTKIFSMMAIAALLLGTSCSNDELNEPSAGQPTTATFSVQLPAGISASKVAANGAKKAYADGKTATKLTYMVYDAAATTVTPIIKGTTSINLTATVQLQLTTGREYNIVFWAADANAPYTLSDNGTVSVDYSKVKANDESLDAFYRCYKYKAGDDAENPIMLNRPFAQLNVGTNDSTAAAASGFKFEGAQTMVKVSGVANTLNLLDGTVAGDTAVTCALNAMPAKEAFPKEGYKYLSMDYLLVGAKQKTNVNVQWQINDGAGIEIARTFANVPVQGNYRTNIYGSLLTSTSDFNVEIDPAFNEPDYATYTAAQFRSAMQKNNSTIELYSDIKLESPLIVSRRRGITVNLNGNTIELTKDMRLNGSTIKFANGKIKCDVAISQCLWAYGGSNITLDHVDVIAPNAAAAFNVSGKTTLTVKGSKIQCKNYCAATNASTSSVVNMTFEGCELKAQSPLFINVPGTLTAKNTKAYGYWQGLVVRGGTANITNCEIYQAFNLSGADETRTPEAAAGQYMTGAWGTGNEIPMAAIVLGTDATSAYQYPTVLNMSGTKVVGKTPFRAVVQKEAGKNTVTYVNGGGNTIDGDWVK